jgi:hypothetical protein
MENNQLLCEYMGYKLAPCNSGMAWESPYLSSIHDGMNLHGRLFREKDKYYKFSTDWNWLVPVIKKIDGEAFTNMSFDKYNDFRTSFRMVDNPVKYHIDDVYKQVVMFIKLNKSND